MIGDEFGHFVDSRGNQIGHHLGRRLFLPIVEKIMKRIIACGLVLLTILFTLGANEDKPQGVFSFLHIGQKVNLREEVQGFTIITFFERELPQSHKVLEIGKDFVILESVSGIETTIPVYSLRAVVKMK